MQHIHENPQINSLVGISTPFNILSKICKVDIALYTQNQHFLKSSQESGKGNQQYLTAEKTQRLILLTPKKERERNNYVKFQKKPQTEQRLKRLPDVKVFTLIFSIFYSFCHQLAIHSQAKQFLLSSISFQHRFYTIWISLMVINIY